MTQLEQELRNDLELLSARAWRATRPEPLRRFLLESSALPQEVSEAGLHQALLVMYQHARYWAGGLDIPYFVPPVYIEALSAAGQFHVDEESYARISVSSSFLCDRDALLVILAHEACHHFLLQAGLVVTDAGRNERTTDLTMFVCGFGKLVIRGHSRASKIGGVYSTTHLGYLTTNDYVEIQRAVLEKRRAAGLLGRDDDEGSLAAPTLFKSWWHGLFGRRARRPGGSSLVEQILAETEKKRGRRGNS